MKPSTKNPGLSIAGQLATTTSGQLVTTTRVTNHESFFGHGNITVHHLPSRI